MNIPEQEHMPAMLGTKKYAQNFPTVVETIESINRVYTDLAETGDPDQFPLGDRLILYHPEAALSAAFIADCDEAVIKDLVKCLEGYLSRYKN